MTGSHGFVGTNLIEALSSDHEIIRWDVRSNEVLPDCDAVIHLAGKAHDTKNATQEDEYFKVNTELTKKIFDAYLKSKARIFIFFSSIKAKDNDTAYAKSKKKAEEYIINHTTDWHFDQTQCVEKSQGILDYARNDKRVYILRPCMIHGKGVKGNLPLLFKFVKKGWPWPLAVFENQRSYAFMGNVSYVVKELLDRDVEFGIYNLCDDETVSTNELIRLISASHGNETKMLRLPKWLVQKGAKIGDVLHLPLNSERLAKLTSDYVVDNSDIKRALNITSLPVSAKEGLMSTIKTMIYDKY